VHVQWRIRDLLTDCLGARDGDTEWWAPLARVDASHFVGHKIRKHWAGMNKEDRARWLIGQLWNCTDSCPPDVAASLDIPGATYASIVRRLAVSDPPDAFAELLRRVEKRQYGARKTAADRYALHPRWPVSIQAAGE
jgi:hypothetical protein